MREIQTASTTTVAGLLQARSPSVVVRGASGAVWAGARIYLRGLSSVSYSAQPLVVLNGARVAAGPAMGIELGGQALSLLDDIDPEEVEEMVILPGPAAAAKYGPEGAAGVIEIRTRRGAATPGVRVRGFVEAGLRDGTDEGPTLWRQVGRLGNGEHIPNCELAAQAGGYCTAIADSLISFSGEPESDLGVQRRAHVSAETGGSWGAVRASLDAGRAEGVTEDERLDRRRVGLDGTLHPMRGVELRLGGYHARREAVLGYADNSVFGYRYHSWLGRVFDEDVSFVPVDDEGKRTTGWAMASWQPLTWLELAARAGHDQASLDDRRVIPGDMFTTLYSTARTDWLRHTAAGSATARYAPMAGVSASTGLQVERWTDRITTFRMDSTGGGWSRNQTWQRKRTVGVGLTQTVDAGRLAGSLTLRRDEAKGIDEEFWSGSMNFEGRPFELSGGEPLRVRAGYGWVRRPLNGYVICGIVPPCPDAPAGQRVREAELGVAGARPTGLGRIEFSLTGYRREADEALIGLNTESRFTVSNTGAEAALRVRPSAPWSAEVLVWANRNRVDEIEDLPLVAFPGNQGIEEGESFGGYFGRRILGFQDANGNGVITAGEVQTGDFEYLGPSLPDHGVVLGGEYHRGRVRLAARIEHQGGNRVLDGSRLFACRVGLCRAQVHPDATLEEQARANAANRSIEPFLEDGSFTRLREVSATVRVPGGLVRALGAGGADLVVAGRNLVTLSAADGMDPEVSYTGADWPVLSSDNLTQPIPRTWTFRLDVRY